MRIVDMTSPNAGIQDMDRDELLAHCEELGTIITEKEAALVALRTKVGDKDTEMRSMRADIRALQTAKAEAEAIAESRQREIDRLNGMLETGAATLASRDRRIEELTDEVEGMNPLRIAELEQEAAELAHQQDLRRQAETADLAAQLEAERQSQERAHQAALARQAAQAQRQAVEHEDQLAHQAAQAYEADQRRKAEVELQARRETRQQFIKRIMGSLKTGFIAALALLALMFPFSFSSFQLLPHVIIPFTGFLLFAIFPQFLTRLSLQCATWVLAKVGISDIALLITALTDSKKEWAETPLTERIAKIFLRFCGVFVAIVVGMALWPEKSSWHGYFIGVSGGIAAMAAFEYFVGLMLKVSFRGGYKGWAIACLYFLGLAVSMGSAMVTFSELYYRNAEAPLFSEVRGDLTEAQSAYLKVSEGLCEEGIATAERKAKEAAADGEMPKAEAKKAEAERFRNSLTGMRNAYAQAKSARHWEELDLSAKAFKEAGSVVYSDLDREVRKKDLLSPVRVPRQPSPIQLGTHVVFNTELEGIRTRAYSGPLWLAIALVFIFEGAVLLIGIAALVMRLGKSEDKKEEKKEEQDPKAEAA